ncbi:MAG: hypothetical protein IPN95_25970 [Bacteroidetes bacterium]|nr:hypothetical protein [Bacteroidota bacterium]
MSAFVQIVHHEFELKGNLKYTLVYVPEGIEANYEEDDIDADSEEDLRLIDAYTREVPILISR